MDLTEQKEVFSALSGESRLRLLQILNDKELSCEDPASCELDEKSCDVGEIAEKLGISAPSVSNHLKELRRADLVTTHKDGRRVYCQLNRERMQQLSDFFSKHS
ncbi:MAG: ArsR/SmtB family transcription factor [bacterium]